MGEEHAWEAEHGASEVLSGGGYGWGISAGSPGKHHTNDVLDGSSGDDNG